MLRELLEHKRTLIVVGPGGVGKTTTAAAFAVQAARMGKKVLVLTVDPARRLANSLGLEELGNQEVPIDPALFAEAGIPLGTGSLHGMMLDTKSTFDDLIERYAPNHEAKQKIFDNAFYQQASTALAGSQEYMAMEKLYEIREQRDYDLIVLDTPPTSNALDFLSAPDRLEDFLGSPATRALIKGMKAAGRVGLGFLKFNTFVMRGLNRFVGADTFLGLLEFVQSFSEMYSGFKARARRVREILRADDVAFVIVTSTNQTTIDEGAYFYEQLARERMPFGALIINRVRPPFLADDELAGLAEHLVVAGRTAGLADRFDGYHLQRFLLRGAELCADYAVVTQVDQDRLAQVRERFGGSADRLYPVPQFERDVHDLASLAAFADHVTSLRPA